MRGFKLRANYDGACTVNAKKQTMIKIRQFQNEFMNSSFLPNYE